MFPADVPVRHGWAWLSDDWRRATNDALDPADLPLIESWRARGLPFVVASSCTTHKVRLGLATRDKRRIGFCVNPGDVVRTAPPLALSDAIDAAPIEWRHPLRVIEEESCRHGLGACVYGSLAWSYRSNMTFVRPESDVDLIFVPLRTSLSRVHAFIRTLANHPGKPRLDGELVMPAGAVSWRELAQCCDTLLVKTARGPIIQARRRFEAALAKREA